MLLAVGCFTTLNSIMKYLSVQHSALFLVWARYAIHATLIATLVPVMGAGRIVKTQRLGLQAIRGLLISLSTFLVVTALGRLPMAQTYAITFATPLIAAALAQPVLGERASAGQWVWIVVGFTGVLIALQPYPSELRPALLLPLGMAVAYAGYQVLTRLAGRDDGPLCQVFHIGLFGTLWMSLALPWTWQILPPASLALLLVGSIFGTLAQFLLILAFRLAETAVISPIGYSQLLWAAAIGYFVFGEVPSPLALIGGAVAALSGIALVHGKAKAAATQL